MKPSALREQDFKAYPPKAKALAVAHLSLLRRIPLTLLPIFLRQLIDYDWRFPAEQNELECRFSYLNALSADSFASLMAPFAAIQLPETLTALDWANHPQQFNEQLSAALWSLHEKDAYNATAINFQQKLEADIKVTAPVVPRFTVVTVGQGVAQAKTPLFRALRPHGVLFTQVKPADGMQVLTNFVAERAKKYPQLYAHWHIDGGDLNSAYSSRQGVTMSSYRDLSKVTRKIQDLTDQFVTKAGANGPVTPVIVQSFLASLAQSDAVFDTTAQDDVMRHFETAVLTEGAGTQVFSTTFVQWAAREAMRRAQPLTMLARFAPRQRFAPMNELLKRDSSVQETDPEGSLVDGDMGAYYTWINQSRLTGADQARFLVWHEGQSLALAISPSLPHGTISAAPADIASILQWMS